MRKKSKEYSIIERKNMINFLRVLIKKNLQKLKTYFKILIQVWKV